MVIMTVVMLVIGVEVEMVVTMAYFFFFFLTVVCDRDDIFVTEVVRNVLDLWWQV